MPGLDLSKLPAVEEGAIVISHRNGVATLRLNRPKQLNGLRKKDTACLRTCLAEYSQDGSVKAVVLTGTGPYYSAGADFADSAVLAWPSTMRKQIAKYNRELFDAFLDFPKPIMVAVNGPAIGAAVTTASLTDLIICSTTASFHTPFAALGLPAEGCSSFNFPRILGKEHAQTMLVDGEKIGAVRAKAFGLVAEVVPPDQLAARAQEIAEDWIHRNYVRPIIKLGLVQKLKDVNREESVALGKAVMEKPFFEASLRIATSQGKSDAAWLFWTLSKLSPIISRL